MFDHLPFADPGTPDLSTQGRFLRWIGLHQKRLLGLGIFWGVVWMVGQALIPGALGAGVQAISETDQSRALMWAGVVLALGFTVAGAGLVRHRFAVNNWITAGARVQQLLIRRAAELGADLPKQVATGEVVAASANDVERIGNAFDILPRMIGAVIAFLAVAAILVFSNVTLGIIVLVGVPLLSLGVAPLVRPLERREREQRGHLGLTQELAADTVAGLRVLRGIGGEDLFLSRFHAESQKVQAAAVRTARIRALLDALQVFLPGLFVVIVTWLGARLALEGELTVGQLVAFYGYTAFLVLPLRTITEAAHKWTAARVAAARVVSVLTLDRTFDEGDEQRASEATKSVSGEITDPATGLVVTPGQLMAVVTDDPDASEVLIDRLGRYRDTDVVLDGTPMDDLPLPTVRERVLVQDKDPMILSGAAEDLFDIPRTGRVDVDSALSYASALDVIEALPEGLATDLPERGRSLSGGQRQRLALARSLVADPEILILDEPTSAVDAHTEARIGISLRDARAGRTTVVFTTSPLLLEHVDTVAFLKDGKVQATGRHRELLRENAGYRYTVTRGEDA
ncbi:MAG TPA: ABC transporter ATP-binding protein [Actinomycetes bacterium]|nr:ABC transporter ATP-binding protein [Actinomycetes bacterium]